MCGASLQKGGKGENRDTLRFATFIRKKAKLMIYSNPAAIRSYGGQLWEDSPLHKKLFAAGFSWLGNTQITNIGQSFPVGTFRTGWLGGRPCVVFIPVRETFWLVVFLSGPQTADPFGNEARIYRGVMRRAFGRVPSRRPGWRCAITRICGWRHGQRPEPYPQELLQQLATWWFANWQTFLHSVGGSAARRCS